MQILFLPLPWTLLLCFIGWFVFQFGAALLCLKMPDRWFSPHRFPFRAQRWESSGRVYAFLRVQRWKRLLPDGAAVLKSGYRKKALADFSPENLDRFMIESCRAEMTHLLAIFPFWVFGLIGPPIIIWMMLGYALIINVPCMIAQRYNRPRIQRILDTYRKRTFDSGQAST